MKSGLVRSKVFGKDNKPTIYYLTGYGTTIKQFGLHMRLLSWKGFRIVGFEYDRTVLVGGEPQLLADAIEFVLESITDDMKTHTVAGVYGISLGTIFAYNVMKLPGIKRVIFSAGGCSILKAVWDVPNDGPVRQAFVKHGYDREAVRRGWDGIDIEAQPSDMTNKKLLLMVSKADRTILYRYVQESISQWQKGSGSLSELTVSQLSHPATIVWNAFRLYKTARFYRS